jgi:predicted nucleotidyltransferase
MKPSVALETHKEAIKEIVERHRATNARLFGSVLRGEDHEGSDIDILVEPTANTTLMDIGAIQVELSELLGVDVDVLTPGALPDRWKSEILKIARPIP